MLLNLLKSRYAQPGEAEDEQVQSVDTTSQKSSSADTFLQTPSAKTFVRKWSDRKVDGRKAFTKRGITALLSAIFQLSALKKDKDVLDACDDILMKLGDMDGLKGFLLGWKARSEGIMKVVKSFVGGE